MSPTVKPTAIYNEIDPFPAEWLRQLIARGAITAGEVLEKSISNVTPAELHSAQRVHLFAGIGGWDLALTLAGWPTDWPVWTASTPCQPWSRIGKQKKQEDARHADLWPEFLRLLGECRPLVIFGEQVRGAYEWGWLDRISADLEDAGYAVGSTILGAHSAGAPHRRQRLYWVAIDRLVDAQRAGLERSGGDVNRQAPEQISPQRPEATGPTGAASAASNAAELGSVPVLRKLLVQHPSNTRPRLRMSGPRGVRERPVQSAWSESAIVDLRDGSRRRAEPLSCPLAYGVPAHVGRVRGYGNAIVPQTAAIFVRAVIDLFRGEGE
jgi:DNA (cytosine-5)-methyltransferase 1